MLTKVFGHLHHSVSWGVLATTKDGVHIWNGNGARVYSGDGGWVMGRESGMICTPNRGRNTGLIACARHELGSVTALKSPNRCQPYLSTTGVAGCFAFRKSYTLFAPALLCKA